jgi:hypothetical protein
MSNFIRTVDLPVAQLFIKQNLVMPAQLGVRRTQADEFIVPLDRLGVSWSVH